MDYTLRQGSLPDSARASYPRPGGVAEAHLRFAGRFLDRFAGAFFVVGRAFFLRAAAFPRATQRFADLGDMPGAGSHFLKYLFTTVMAFMSASTGPWPKIGLMGGWVSPSIIKGQYQARELGQ